MTQLFVNRQVRSTFCLLPQNIFISSIHSSCRNQKPTAFQSLEEDNDIAGNSREILLVSPPHPTSNIRRIQIKGGLSENGAWYNDRERMQEYHHQFWNMNNTHFATAKVKFENEIRIKTLANPTPEDYSRFYRLYLIQNRDRYMEYNKRWWKENFVMLKPAFLAAQRTIFQSLKSVILSRLWPRWNRDVVQQSS